MDIDNKELLTNVATNLITDSVKGAWGKVVGFFKDVEKKDSIEYGRAYEKYVENTKERFGKVKTIIYRRVPKNLYSFYECIGVEYNGEYIDTITINNLIHSNSKILITGTGGIGKSTMMKHFFLNVLEDTEQIPIFIELRSINVIETKDISLYKVLYENLQNNGFMLEEKYFEYSMKEGAYIILFDGYDEVNTEKMLLVSREIRNLSTKYDKNKYIVSSRPLEEFIGWNDYSEMTTTELTKKQALSLISKIEFDENIKMKFSEELDKHLYDDYKSFASNPLLLTIMLLTFDNCAAIPDKLNDFYERAFSTLFNMHDASKDAYVRDIRSNLGCEDFKSVFSYVCFKSYFKGEFEFSDNVLQKHILDAKNKFDRLSFRVEDFLEDLTQSVCMLVRDGINYRFTHRSFQEYFAALYTCKLTDDIQEKLLLGWLKEGASFGKETFFAMLFNLQSEKVNRIIFCPIIKQLKKQYEQYGYTIELLSELFNGIGFRSSKKSDVNEPSKPNLSLYVKDSYITFGIRMICKLNNYSYQNVNEEDSEKLMTLLLKIEPNGHFITFEKAIEEIDKDQLLKGLEWYHSRVLYALSILSKYENSTIGESADSFV